MRDRADAIAGALLGGAYGDALGLPYEGLSAQRGPRLLGQPDQFRLFGGCRGMVSDDTEHACMTAKALCHAPHDPTIFARRLAREIRWWLLGIPAGVGLATLRATLKLWLGWPPSRSGVYSAGNGPAMRSSVLGAAIDDLDQLRNYVRASTLLTHRDPKAFDGAWGVAIAAWLARRGVNEPVAACSQLRDLVGPDVSPEFLDLLERLHQSLQIGQSTREFAISLGCKQKVSGYIYQTVPVVLHAWLSHPGQLQPAVQAVILCGGDTDTTAAILGGIIGSGTGAVGVPHEQLAWLFEPVYTTGWMTGLSQQVALACTSRQPVLPPRMTSLITYLRNLWFLVVVLTHGFRRLLPPYS